MPYYLTRVLNENETQFLVLHQHNFQIDYTIYLFLLLQEVYPRMAPEVEPRLRELYEDFRAFLLHGQKVDVLDALRGFFDALFPSVYYHALNPKLTDFTDDYKVSYLIDCFPKPYRFYRWLPVKLFSPFPSVFCLTFLIESSLILPKITREIIDKIFPSV